MIAKLKEHWLIVSIIIIFFCAQLFSLFSPADLWWDASVYIGMGKYIYSLGHAGLWESERSLVWPLILGFFWKTGFNEIFLGKITTLFMSAGCIALTYILGLQYFNKTTALLSSLFMGFTPIFFLYTSVLQTEIPSTFFLLLGIYYIEKKPFLTGILFGISMMTRFFQIIVIFPVLLYLLIKKRQQIIYYLTGFCIPILLFFIVNWFLYSNLIYPFTLQAYMTQNTGWIFYQPWTYYFTEIFKQNILFAAAIIGCFFILKEKSSEKILIPAVFILGLIPFLFEAHKEIRLLIPLLPFLCLLTGYGINSLFDRFPAKNSLYILLILSWLAYTAPLLHTNTYEDNLDFFYSADDDAPSQGLWISNPSMIAYTDKTAELIYFPLYNTEKIHALKARISTAQMIMINSCDILPCPASDSSCDIAHTEFIELLQQNFKTTTRAHGECTYYLFEQ